MTGNTDMHLLVTDTLKKVGAWIKQNMLVSGVPTIYLMPGDTSPSHRVDQAIDCGLWNAVPLLFNGCATLLNIGGTWSFCQTYLSRASHTCSMGDMSGEYEGHGKTGTFKEFCTFLTTWGPALSC